MTEHTGNPSSYASLRATRRALARMAPMARVILALAGVVLFLDRVGPLLADVQLTYGERLVAGIVALVVLGGCGLAAWVVGVLLRASAEMIDVVVDQAEAARRTADLIEHRVAPTLGRLAVALERASSSPRASDSDGRDLAVEGVRRAIASRLWERAERLLEAFRRDYPDAPEAEVLGRELAAARRAILDDLKARLDAARRAGDTDRVLSLRDALTEHLRGEPLRDLDRRLAGWLAGVIRAQRRRGAVGPETVALATQVVDTFGDTPEAASLLAALPALRREAGLCPGCGGPYRGPAPTCPRCRNGGSVPAPHGPDPENVP